MKNTIILKYLSDTKYLLIINFLFLLFFILYWNSDLNFLKEFFNQDALYLSNLDYLSHLSSELLTKSAELLALSTLIDVASTSELGISFFVDANVEVGQLLQNFSELLDKGIEYFLLALGAVQFSEILIKFFDILSPYLLVLILLYTFLWCFIALFDKNILQVSLLHNIMYGLFSMFIFIHLAFPYSVHISSKLTHVVNVEFGYDTDNKYFKSIVHELHKSNHQQANKIDVKQHAENGMDFLKKALVSNIHHKVQRSSDVIMKLIAYQLLVIVVIPLALSLLLFFFFKELFNWQFILRKI